MFRKRGRGGGELPLSCEERVFRENQIQFKQQIQFAYQKR